MQHANPQRLSAFPRIPPGLSGRSQLEVVREHASLLAVFMLLERRLNHACGMERCRTSSRYIFFSGK